MQITLLLFGILKDIIGSSDLNLSINEGVTVEKLKQQLAEEYTELNNYNYTVAINEAYAQDDSTLADKDIVALIPPVSGG